MFTETECAEFLSHDTGTGPQAFGASPVAAINLAAILNKLLELGTSLPAIFAKAMAIYAIVSGPGTWLEKANKIFALFSMPPQPSITLAD